MAQHFALPGARDTGPTSCDAAPRLSPGQHAHGLEPPVSAESQDWHSGRVPAAADQTVQRPGRYQHEHRSLCGVPGKMKKEKKGGCAELDGLMSRNCNLYRNTKGEFSTWCLSRRASAPVTSLASSSEDTSPRMPLIQDIRSLCADGDLQPTT